MKINTHTASRFHLPGAIKKALFATLALCLCDMLGGTLGDTPHLLVFQPHQALAETTPAAAQPGGDGAKILDKHCLNCHVIEKISHYRKSKEQWEQTIANMIANDGVVLTEAEKTALLDYFASLRKPEGKAP